MDGSTTLAVTDSTDGPTMPEENQRANDSSHDVTSHPDGEAIADSTETAENRQTSDTPDAVSADADAHDTRMEDETAADGPQMDRKRIVEAVLMAAESPMTAGKIASIAGSGTGRDIKKDIQSLNADYEAHGLSFSIEEVAGGFQILTRPEYNSWLTKLLRVRQETKLSPAAMETLAIVAYKQPCTRAEVEAIRGVAAGEMINRLREMNIVKIAGRAEDLGRPLLYGTTKKFLEVFGLPSLEDLPQVEALRPPSAKPPKIDVEETVEAEAKHNAEDSAENEATNIDEDSDGQATESQTTVTTEGDENAPELHIVHDEDDEESQDATA